MEIYVQSPSAAAGGPKFGALGSKGARWKARRRRVRTLSPPSFLGAGGASYRGVKAAGTDAAIIRKRGYTRRGCRGVFATGDWPDGAREMAPPTGASTGRNSTTLADRGALTAYRAEEGRRRDTVRNMARPRRRATPADDARKGGGGRGRVGRRTAVELSKRLYYSERSSEAAASA